MPFLLWSDSLDPVNHNVYSTDLADQSTEPKFVFSMLIQYDLCSLPKLDQLTDLGFQSTDITMFPSLQNMIISVYADRINRMNHLFDRSNPRSTQTLFIL